MSDFPALTKAVADAESAKAALVIERQEKRATLPPVEFRAYNVITRVQQLDVTAAGVTATKALQDALKVVRSDAVAQVIDVGTLHESNKVGGAS